MNLYIKNKLLHVFVMLVLFVVPIMKAMAQQAPGGTNYNVEMWFAADKLISGSTPSHEDDVAVWEDLSPNKANLVQTTTEYQPKYFSEGDLMNFQPSVQLTVAAQRLVSASAKTTVNTKSYYMFIVSQNESTAANCAVFTLTSTDYTLVGWNSSNPYFLTDGSATTFTGADRSYGITGAIIPNNAATTPKRIYFNGASTSVSTAYNMTNNLSTNFVVGSRADNATYPFLGKVQEIIVLSSDTKGLISDDAANKINSYLAIKYGITLKNQTYVGSSGNVWTPVTGYNTYVFGIGRDDATGLDQRQSSSYDDKKQTFSVFAGDYLADLNIDNSTEIPNGGYLMFGSNGKIGEDIAYTHPSATGVTHRSNAVLKAQKNAAFTGTVGFNVKHPLATYILVSSTEDFTAGSTRVYPVVSGAATGVVVNDGDYVAYAISRDKAVSPGGVGANLDTELWLSADKVRFTPPADGAKLNSWMDMSAYGRSLSQETANLQPTFNSSSNVMNFQPAVNFSAADQRLLSEEMYTNYGNRSYYVFYVSNVSNSATAGVKSVFSYNTTGNNVHGWNAATTTSGVNPIMSTAGVAVANLSTYAQDTPVKTYGIIGGIRPNDGTAAEIYFNGSNKALTGTASPARMVEVEGNYLIGSSNDGVASPFIGDVQEVIVYSTATQGKIQEADAVKINSYLALKYGLTLTKGDYTGTPGTVWSRSTNTGYASNIFGVGYDSKTGLYQKQSQSFETNGNILTAFVGDKIADLNVKNTGTINDNAYLVFGSNGVSDNLSIYSHETGAAGFAGGTSPAKDISHKSGTIWKAQKTGTIDVKFRVAYPNASHLLVSTSENFEPTNTRIYALDRDGVTENTIPVATGEFIAFAVSAGYTPGATGSTIELWLSADKLLSDLPSDSTNVTLWQDRSINKRDHVSNGTNAVPTFNKSNNLMNFQPSLLFGSATNTKLIGPANFLQANKSYHVFYVSRIGASDGTRRVVYAFNAGRNNNHGWVDGKPFANTAGITNRVHAGNGKLYGINAVLRPNNASDIKIYMNGLSNSLAGGAMGTATGQSVIGNSDDGTGYPFINGEIQEIIVLSKNQGEYLDETAGGELSRINTYLALKYGITLQSGDYYNSGGTSVWTRDDNTGYTHNIFGIARDDKNGLYQAQGQSYDNPTFIVFKGKLADLNIDNHTEMDDMSYLIFGSNDKTTGASTVFAYDLGDPFQDGTKLENSATHRADMILKAQATAQSIVNITVTYLNASNVIVSSSPDFTQATTRVYPIGTDGVARNVKINSGEYVSFTVNTIKPGGTAYNMELWLKADQVHFSVPADGTPISSWMDVSGNKRNAVQTTMAYQPKFNIGSKLMSYQPSLNFTTAAQRLQTQNYIVPEDTKSYYIFYVSEYTGATSTTPATVFGMTYTNLQSWRNNTPFLSKNSATALTNAISFNQKAGTKKKYGIVGAIRPNNAATVDRLFFNGASQTGTNSARMPEGNTNNGHIGSGYAAYQPFYGNVQEIVVLSTTSQGDIDPVEAQKINTYFALKYGITLDEGDYLNGRDEVIWKRSEQGAYVHKIFGLGRDDRSGLYQKQASPYDESVFSVYLDDLASLNIYNAGKLEEREFVIFAAKSPDNIWSGKRFLPGTAFENTTLAADEEINLINNIFKANFVNVEGDKKTLGFKGDVNMSKYLLVSKDSTFPADKTRMYRLDADGKVDNVEIENGEYVTVATLGYGPAGVIDGIRLWLKADDKSSLNLTPSVLDPNVGSYTLGRTPVQYDWDVTEWQDLSGKDNNFRADLVGYGTRSTSEGTTAIKPKYLECSEEVNFQPAVRFPTQKAGLGLVGGPFSVDAPDHATIFIVYRLTDSDNGYSADLTRQYTMGFGYPMTSGVNAGKMQKDEVQSRYPAIGFSPRYTGTRVRNQGVGTTDMEGSRGYKTEATAMHMVHLTKGASSDGTGPKLEAEFSAYPDVIATVPTGTWGNGFRLASGATLGGGSYYRGQFTGVIAEVIAFERELSESEKDRVNTYLGLKYAMTLSKDPVNNTDNYDYILSDGTVVWAGDSEPYKNFHNNVAGLFRDDQADAFVNKSKSTADAAMIMMKVPGVESCGQGEKSGLPNDYGGLFWGNNGKITTSQFQDPATVCGLQEKSDRMWLVHKTNLDDQEVYLGIATSGVSAYTSVGAGYEVYILVADSQEKLDNDEWDYSIPTVYNKETKMHEARYTFRKENTYFRLASRASATACESCEFDGTKTLEFTAITRANPAGTWPNTAFPDLTSARETVQDLGDGFSVKVKAGFESPQERAQFSSRRYPRAYRARVFNVDPTTGRRVNPAIVYNTLQETRRRDLYVKMITEIIPHVTGDTTNYTASAMSFRIFDIDRQGYAMDDIQIYGVCEGDIIAPTRVVRAGGVLRRVGRQTKDENRYAFERRSNQNMRAKSSSIATAAYTDPKGHLDVYFDYPVTKVVVAHSDVAYRGLNIRNSSQQLGIGPISFTCPQPLPPINEDGIAFQKSANKYKDIPSCEPVEYTFKILNATNYSAKMKFTDTLDEGMKWSLGTLKMDSVNMADATIELSEDGRTLTIDGLIVPGCSSIYQFSASGYFEESETTAKSYSNQATLDYQVLVLDPDSEDVYGSTLSCDAFSAEGTCSPTTIKTIDTDRPKFVQVSHTGNCFKPDTDVHVKITVNNENGEYNGVMYFEANFNEEFTYKTGTFKASGTGYSATDPLFEMYDDEDLGTTVKTPGYFYIENFTLPVGVTTIEFTLTAPSKDDMIYDSETDELGNEIFYDKNGNITTNPAQYVPMPLEVLYSFDADVTGVCASSAFNEANDILVVYSCDGKPYIITNRHVTPAVQKY